VSEAFRRFDAATQPPYDAPAYGSTHKRHPTQPLLRVPHSITETAPPRMDVVRYPAAPDLSRDASGRDAAGQRIIVSGRVLDEDGRGVSGAMLEVWQANAAGRYALDRDDHDAPLDPHFRGAGRVFSDAHGHYSFTTIRPGAYPWRNHFNAWRPEHIHFSLFGAGFAQRLITQMYFAGDPLLPLDPVLGAVPDAAARDRLVARFDLETTKPEWALGWRFDIVLRGREATPMENPA